MSNFKRSRKRTIIITKTCWGEWDAVDDLSPKAITRSLMT